MWSPRGRDGFAQFPRGLDVAANVSELFRSLEESSLADLPFLVRCGRITQPIDFLACQFRRFRSLVSSGTSPSSTREPQLQKPTDGFGAAPLIGLSCRPGVHIFTHPSYSIRRGRSRSFIKAPRRRSGRQKFRRTRVAKSPCSESKAVADSQNRIRARY